MGSVQCEDDCWILAALTLVDADGVGQLDVIELLPAELYGPSLEVDSEGTACCHRDGADISIEDVVVVVVSQLNDSVTLPKDSVATLDGFTVRVQARLERCVERLCSKHAIVHGCQHLDISHWIEAALGESAGDDLYDGSLCIQRLAAMDLKEVWSTIIEFARDRRLACVDAVCILDDPRVRSLAVDLSECGHRELSGCDDVTEYATCAH